MNCEPCRAHGCRDGIITLIDGLSRHTVATWPCSHECHEPTPSVPFGADASPEEFDECMKRANAPTCTDPRPPMAEDTTPAHNSPRIEAQRATVKRASLWDGVQDTRMTETELNGFREKQGALL